MEDRLQILQALYGEAEDDTGVRRLLREDANLWQEYQAMSEAKFALDHRCRRPRGLRVSVRDGAPPCRVETDLPSCRHLRTGGPVRFQLPPLRPSSW